MKHVPQHGSRGAVSLGSVQSWAVPGSAFEESQWQEPADSPSKKGGFISPAVTSQ